MPKWIWCLFLITAFPVSAAAPTARAAISFSPGFLTAQKSIAFAATGEFEIYDAPSLGIPSGRGASLRADFYGFFVQQPAAQLKQNYQAFFGLVFNVGELRGFTPFFGFQPGFGMAEVSTATGALHAYPVLSPLMGTQFFFSRSVHLSFTLRYVFGEMGYRTTGAVYFSEARASLGFGFFW